MTWRVSVCSYAYKLLHSHVIFGTNCKRTPLLLASLGRSQYFSAPISATAADGETAAASGRQQPRSPSGHGPGDDGQVQRWRRQRLGSLCGRISWRRSCGHSRSCSTSKECLSLHHCMRILRCGVMNKFSLAIEEKRTVLSPRAGFLV